MRTTSTNLDRNVSRDELCYIVSLMQIVLPHKFSRSEALQRIKDALNEARPKFKDQVEIHEEKWEGGVLTFSFTAQGYKISGTLAVEDSQYVLNAKLPLMFRLFEGTIEAKIKEQIAQMPELK